MSDIPLKFTGDTLNVIAATKRAGTSSFAASEMNAIGVAALIQGDDDEISLRWSGYAASDDMARAFVVAFILKHVRQNHQLINICCRPIETLRHIEGARSRGGMRSGKNKGVPFAAYTLFDFVERAKGDYWSLYPIQKRREPPRYAEIQSNAEKACSDAEKLVDDFHMHNTRHPDWWFIKGDLSHVIRDEVGFEDYLSDYH
ncbi:hypothetical protein TRICHSKD4_1598 [Roseibium sp. TrichSKD4]|nr:hypothetical protein TRICHSKD4_1598 [Roseibium sp. TrichSKD4]